MSCCGSKRQALAASPSRTLQNETAALIPAAAREPQPVNFRYTGDSVLEVRGFLNRRRYRFTIQSPIVSVAAEDISILHGYDELTLIK